MPLCHHGALTGWHSRGPAPRGHSLRCSCRFVCSGYLSCSRVSLWLHLKANPLLSSAPACHLRITAGPRALSARTWGTGAEEPQWFEKQPLLPCRFLESQVCPREVLPKLWVNPAAPLSFARVSPPGAQQSCSHPQLGAGRAWLLPFLSVLYRVSISCSIKMPNEGCIPSVTLGRSGCPLSAAGWLWCGDGRRSQHSDKQIDSKACPGAGGAARQPWPQSLAGTLLKSICTSANNRSLAGS